MDNHVGFSTRRPGFEFRREYLSLSSHSVVRPIIGGSHPPDASSNLAGSSTRGETMSKCEVIITKDHEGYIDWKATNVTPSELALFGSLLQTTALQLMTTDGRDIKKMTFGGRDTKVQLKKLSTKDFLKTDD